MYLRVTRENLIFLNHEYRNCTMPLLECWKQWFSNKFKKCWSCITRWAWRKQKTLILDLFVDNNSTSTLGDIENTASFAMVHLVRHSFVDGTIYLNNKKKLIYSCSRCTQKTTLNNFSHGCISRQMYTNKEKHLHVSLPYACIILPMAALALLVEHLAAERKVTGSIPRHRPILRVLKSTEK